MKKVIALVLVSAMALLSFTGCSNSSTGSDAGNSSSNSKSAKSINIDLSQIDWTVEEGVFEDERAVVFGYTNNTDYDIADFSITFKVKEDVEEDELKKHDELVEKAKTMEDDLKDLTFEATTHRVVPAGESIDNQVCTLDGTVEFFNDFEAYELFEPDIMDAVVVNGDKVQLVYYDFKSGKTTPDETNITDAYTWSDSELAKKVPKLDTRFCSVSEYDTTFYADAYGTTEDDFNKYVEACKDSGFTKDVEEEDYTYTLDYEGSNEEGITVEVEYNKYNEHISIEVNKDN